MILGPGGLGSQGNWWGVAGLGGQEKAEVSMCRTRGQ